VVDSTGAPLPGATVEAALVGTVGARRGTADAKGLVRLAGLASDSDYRLTVTPPPDRWDLAGDRRAAWRPAATRVTLDAADPIEGSVRTETGFVANAVVWWKTETGDWQRSTAGTDGAFAIATPAGAKVSLRAARSGSTSVEGAGPLVESRAGAKDVVLRP
jgi:hypothetical protein